jgi:hypothetical protein
LPALPGTVHGTRPSASSRGTQPRSPRAESHVPNRWIGPRPEEMDRALPRKRGRKATPPLRSGEDHPGRVSPLRRGVSVSGALPVHEMFPGSDIAKRESPHPQQIARAASHQTSPRSGRDEGAPTPPFVSLVGNPPWEATGSLGGNRKSVPAVNGARPVSASQDRSRAMLPQQSLLTRGGSTHADPGELRRQIRREEQRPGPAGLTQLHPAGGVGLQLIALWRASGRPPSLSPGPGAPLAQAK